MNYESASEYWVISEYDIDYTNASGEAEAIYTDVWVDPNNGQDEENTLGDQNNPFLTIDYAMGMIYPTEGNPVTIHLTSGIFSPSNNNEIFPIIMFSHLNLIGQGEEVTILDAEETDRVITMENCQINVISDATITGGLAEDVTGDGDGGGIYIDDSNPTLNNVTIRHNTAEYYGGGMYVKYSEPILTNITISGNMADRGGGINISLSDHPIMTNITIAHNTADQCGGMRIYYSNPTLNNVTIRHNTADHNGGGMSVLYNSNPILSNVTIAHNTADYSGGMRIDNANPKLTNVTIADNRAIIEGGGIVLSYSNSTFTHVTIANNMADYSGGMLLFNSNPTLTNSIIWGNIQGSIVISSGSPIITYSNIEGGWEGEGEGNINLDPLFTDSENQITQLSYEENAILNTLIITDSFKDLTLVISNNNRDHCEEGYVDDCSGDGDCCPELWIGDGFADCEDQAYGCDLTCYDNDGGDCTDPFCGDGTCNGEEDEVTCAEDCLSINDYSLQEDSPCIDAGTIIEGMEYCGDAPDMGAFEYITEDCEESTLSGDLNSDGLINVLDVVVLVNIVLGGSEPVDAGDLNGDGILNVLDVVMLVNIILNG
jgi:hypothetical protein